MPHSHERSASAQVPNARTMSEQELADAFARSVEASGHTLFVCTPWAAPLALTRAWCLYEILETMRAAGGKGVSFSVCLPPGERASFRAALLDDPESVESDGILKVDVRKAVAKSEDDRRMIFGWIRDAGGFSLMNSTVKAALRKWVLSAGQRELELLEAAHGGGGRPAARFAMRLAGNLVDTYALEEADALYASSVACYDELVERSTAESTAHPTEENSTAHRELLIERYEVLNGLGELRLKQGRLPEAATHYEEVVGGLEEVLASRAVQSGVDTSDAVTSQSPKGNEPEVESESVDWERLLMIALNGLGNVKVKQKELDMAEALFLRTIEGRERLLRSDHPDTLKVRDWDLRRPPKCLTTPPPAPPPHTHPRCSTISQTCGSSKVILKVLPRP